MSDKSLERLAEYIDLVEKYQGAPLRFRLIVDWLITNDLGNRLLRGGVYDRPEPQFNSAGEEIQTSEDWIDITRDFPTLSHGEQAAWRVVKSLWDGGEITNEDWDMLTGQAGRKDADPLPLLVSVADLVVAILTE